MCFHQECSKCGTTKKKDEVIRSYTTWTAWGGNSFDFNWSKNKETIDLCQFCEQEDWVVCGDCSALIDTNYYGVGFSDDDCLGDFLCPECIDEYHESK